MVHNCNLCPRRCNIDRDKSLGFCGSPQNVKLARAALHFWEEPCISGSKGSGTVFFSGCNLRCVYCQNISISRQNFGKEVSAQRLGEIFVELYKKGAHNINLVTPTPYIPQIIEAIDSVKNLVKIPFVYNTGGYERPESLELLRGYIDIFLTDIKYKSSLLSQKYSNASDYFDIALAATKKMIDICPSPVLGKDGIMQRGVIIRHLVLPNCRKDSIDILKSIAAELPENSFLLSLMSQYTPDNDILFNFPELRRKITTFEYRSVTDAAIDLGLLNGYMQERESAQQKYTPPFDLSGV
jgi:putative pyruvate formate lyase activating enzyme